MNQAADMLVADNLTKTYGRGATRLTAVAGVSLAVSAGEILGLLGPNAAGKTTLIKMILGLIAPDQGQVIINGRAYRPAEPRPSIGGLPENFRPNPQLTVREYLKLIARLVGSDPRGLEDRLDRLGLAEHARRRIGRLSKGLRQRVGLAQAFIGDPEILILDEPTSGLDPLGRKEVIDLLLDLKGQGRTLFFCSHILAEAEKVCDSIGILARGEMRFLGKPAVFRDKWGGAELEEAFIQEVA